MKTLLTIPAMILASCSTLLAIESADIVTTRNDGRTETKTVKLEKLDADTTRLTIKAADIGNDVKSIDIFADNAKAKKGDEGYWVLNRGLLGKFNSDNGAYKSAKQYMYLPYYAMKTPNETFIGVVDGMRFEFNVNVDVKDGVYTMYPRWFISEIGFKPYEDINITFYTLPKDADYNDMAKAYRKHRFAQNRNIEPIKQRLKHQKHLEQLARSFPVRMGIAQKPFNRLTDSINFTPQTEHPVNVRCSFENGVRLLKQMKAMGMDDVFVCVCGWQTGGYDGRCPASFPVCVEAGGEAGLKTLIKAGQEQGYLVDGHSNYTDCFTCSPMWSEQIVSKSPEGKLELNGAWSGGRAYNLCLANAWNTFLPADLERIAALGFRGAHYIDVFTAVHPYRCCDAKHPANRKQQGDLQAKVAQRCRERMGGFASECGFDHFIDKVDYINYVCAAMRAKRNNPKDHQLIDTFVPFWELVYHDVVLSNPDKITQGKLTPEDNLKLVEFGGRPIFYAVNDNNMKDLKVSYDQFAKLRHLMLEEMISHKQLADGVFQITYSDGTEIVVNYTDKPFAHNDQTVEARNFKLCNR